MRNQTFWQRSKKSPSWSGESEVIVHHPPFWCRSPRRMSHLRVSKEYHHQNRSKKRTHRSDFKETNHSPFPQSQRNVSNTCSSRNIRKRKSLQGSYRSRQGTKKVAEETTPQRTRHRPRNKTYFFTHMINERFKTYFRETFFHDDEKGFMEFLSSLEKPITRTIRIKREKIDEVKARLEQDGWILEKTDIDTVFELHRQEDFNPLERRIGFTLDHLIGNFYIQELAAAHPVHLLADEKVQTGEFLILDMASSPGGKTTQLVEYFPNSFIVANEPTRERIPQLLQNLERMGTPNVGITLYPGQFWKEQREVFDLVLLDAPCSGE